MADAWVFKRQAEKIKKLQRRLEAQELYIQELLECNASLADRLSRYAGEDTPWSSDERLALDQIEAIIPPKRRS